MSIKEVIVVEGINDSKRLIEIFNDIDTITTNGSQISIETLELIKKASINRGVIIFTDPDYPGERIRKIVSEYVKDCKHAFINKNDAISKNNKKVGIEHASKDVIIKALEGMLTPAIIKSDITSSDLFRLHLIGHSNSSILRKHISETFKIGYTNGKTLLKRLNLFGISLKALEKEVRNYENR